MDQTASACSTEGHALHLDCRDLSIRQVPFDLPAHGLRLLVVDTRVKHALGDGEYAERREGCEEGARLLGVPFLRDVRYEDLDASLARLSDERVRRYVRHVVSDDHRVDEVIALLDAGDVRGIGPILTSGPCLLAGRPADLLPGAGPGGRHGERGGGAWRSHDGGWVRRLGDRVVEAADADTVTKAVEEAFAAAGFTAPRVFTAVPSEGARRVG
jgi:galactokinase